MKKLFLILCLMFFSILPALAEYKPIPKELSAQYKAEMEQIIKDNYSPTVIYISQQAEEAYYLYKCILNYPTSQKELVELEAIAQVAIPYSDIKIFEEMAKATQEKYLKIKYVPFDTGDSIVLSEYMYPYLTDNNVDIKLLKKIYSYMEEETNKINSYIQEIQNANILHN